jgi:ectoine hydroxylase-related dioxygenase (phytanoyl-CoA dioxygenase family)
MIRSQINRAMTFCKDAALACRGVVQFISKGEADQESWRACLDLHCRTNGQSTAMLLRVIQMLRPRPAPLRSFDSLLGHFEPKRVEMIVSKIGADGYYAFDQLIDPAICDQIAEAAKNVEARAGRDPSAGLRMARFDSANPVARVYDVPEQQSWQMPAYQMILADPAFVNIAQTYLKTESALKQVNLWWSTFVDGKPEKDDHAAQMFHFDFDPAPRWLKFFVYLTDVTAETGPHIYVRGSHTLNQHKSRELLSRGYVRIPDDEIARVYGSSNIIELSGPKGTVLAVDTMGFHKGKPPISGHRLIAQLEYSTPMFVQSNSNPLKMPAAVIPELAAARKTYPQAFVRYPA